MSALIRISGERGSALFLAIILVVLLSAVGAVATLSGQSETLLAANFRQGHEALYVADGALQRAVSDLTDLPDWTAILSGVATSTVLDGPAAGSKPVPGGGTRVLCCGSSSLTADLQARGNGGGDWGANTPQWQIYAWGPAAGWLAADKIHSVFYAVVWVSDDVGDADGNPAADSNATVNVMALAIGPRGARRAVHALVQRVPVAAGLPGRVRVVSWSESRW
ncbi:MAG: pilus assembly PilX N-terminal domain-containing protein [Vicinamibacterales bacterium]